MGTEANRLSGPALTPELWYHDAHGAIRWQSEVLGMRPGLVVDRSDGAVAHAELWWQDAAVYVGTHDTQDANQGGSVVCLAAKDRDEVDRIYQAALDAKADITLPLADTPLGSHQFAVRDPEGHVWTIGTYLPRPPSAERP